MESDFTLAKALCMLMLEAIVLGGKDNHMGYYRASAERQVLLVWRKGE